MKSELNDILVCPVCKSGLELTVVEEKPGGEIVTGSLRCSQCDITYPIADGIPNLLPPGKD